MDRFTRWERVCRRVCVCHTRCTQIQRVRHRPRECSTYQTGKMPKRKSKTAAPPTLTPTPTPLPSWLESGDIPTYDLDLDLPPLERWGAIAADYKTAFHTILHSEANAELMQAVSRIPAFVAFVARRALPPNQVGY